MGVTVHHSVRKESLSCLISILSMECEINSHQFYYCQRKFRNLGNIVLKNNIWSYIFLKERMGHEDINYSETRSFICLTILVK